MPQRIVIFEAEGGIDKDFTGYRKDSVLLLDALKKRGYEVEILKFRDEWFEEIYQYVKNNFAAYIPRIKKGNLPDGEHLFFNLLRRLSDVGITGFPHPEVIDTLADESFLVSLTGTGLVRQDSYIYEDIEVLQNQFAKNLSQNSRFLKFVSIKGRNYSWRLKPTLIHKADLNSKLNPQDKIKITALENDHVIYQSLEEFFNFLKILTQHKEGYFLDKAFLPRIKEGKIRLLMLADQVLSVYAIHKNIRQDFKQPHLYINVVEKEKHKALIHFFTNHIKDIFPHKSVEKMPLLWTADFIKDWDENGNDSFVLSKIDANCIDFDLNKGTEIANKLAIKIHKLMHNKS